CTPRPDHEPVPLRCGANEHVSRREVLSGRQGDRERLLARLLPPVDFLDVTDASRSQQPAVTERRHDQRMEAPLERAQGAEIAVIVVIMTEEHECDGGQIAESTAWCASHAVARE